MRSNRQKLGDIGEAIVAYYVDGVLSENKYDMKKDMVLSNGEFAEVKTQNRHKWRHEFTVNLAHSNQLKKCVSVDRLFFVEYDDSDDIRVWECTNREYSTFTTKDGREMAGWPIKYMTLFKTITEASLARRMRQLSQSKDY